jgi:hypothetical protein
VYCAKREWVAAKAYCGYQAHWPKQLIVDSILAPKECFTVFDRRLSHIKVAWQPQRQLEAKAYLWFEHRWLRI